MTTLTEIEFELDEDTEGVGDLIITDLSALIRPATQPQYYHVSHDTGYSYGVLCLGNDMGLYNTYILTSLSPDEAHRALDGVFHAFVDSCVMQLDCDACVSYMVGTNIVRTEEYGIVNGNYTQYFYVYCSVSDEETENRIAGLLSLAYGTALVVRPDAEEGYAIQAFDVVNCEPEELEDNGSGETAYDLLQDQLSQRPEPEPWDGP